MTTGERSEPGIFKKCMQKYPHIMLKMLFSEMYILKSPGGPDPPPRSRSAPEKASKYACLYAKILQLKLYYVVNNNIYIHMYT